MGLSESHCCEGSEEDKTQTGAENGSKQNSDTLNNKVLSDQNKESDVDQPSKWRQANQQDSTLITESVNISNDLTNTDGIPNLQETPAKKENPFQFDPRLPSSAVDRTPIAINKKVERLGSSIDPRSPSVGIQRTPVVLPELPEITADENDVKCSGIFDPRSPSNQIVRTPLRVKETATDNLRKEVLISNALIPAKDGNVSLVNSTEPTITQTPVKAVSGDPRSPSSDLTRTPINSEGSKLNSALLDPRSPTIGIQRTPILAEELEEELITDNEVVPSKTEIITDPRLPSVEIERTPLKVNQCDEDEPDTDTVVLPEVTITSDPQAQVTEFTRTPLKLPVTENLRRTVLLSNTFMPPPANTENQSTNDEQIDKDDCSRSGLLSEQLLNLSCASNLNYSHTSSTFATCDSDSVHMDSFDDEQDDLTIDEAESSSFGDDWQDKEDVSLCAGDNDDGRTSFSQAAISNFVEEMIRQVAPQEAGESKASESAENESDSVLLEASTHDNRVELLANRSLPVQKHERKPVIDADMPKQRRASESERSTPTVPGERTKLKLKLQKPSSQQQGVYKRSLSEKCIATSGMGGKSAPRLPLSVLGHGNSPDVIKPKLTTGASKSRLPRYRGKQRRSLGGTPPHFSAPLDTAKFGKEN